MHLRPDELIDVAEGARTEQSVPHLAACEMCRRQLVELKAMMSAVADVEVPEPSPLFWDHFSTRVREAVAAEGAPRRSFWTWPRLAVPAVAVALAGRRPQLRSESRRSRSSSSLVMQKPPSPHVRLLVD